MLALSLWEPHATAIAEGIKKYETRGWDLLPRYIGVPVAIHASKREFRERDYEWEWFKECRERLRAVGVPLHRLSYGRIVCFTKFVRSVRTAVVRRHRPASELFWGDFRDRDDDGNDRFAFEVDDVHKIPFELRPPIVGRQGIFHVPDSLQLILGTKV